MGDSRVRNPFKRTSIHRKLVLRLVVVTVLISAVLGLSVILAQWNRVGEVILNQSITASRDFNALVLPYLDQPGIPDRAGLERELRTFASRGVKNPLGRFANVPRSLEPNPAANITAWRTVAIESLKN